MITRRSLFLGSAAVILTPGVLMPVRKLVVPMDCWVGEFLGQRFVVTSPADFRMADVTMTVAEYQRAWAEGEPFDVAGHRRVVTIPFRKENFDRALEQMLRSIEPTPSRLEWGAAAKRWRSP